MDRNKVLALLTAHNIPYEKWGRGEASTIDHLVKQMSDGEATLEILPGHGLTRVAKGATVDVFYWADRVPLYLKEDRQVFIDGRVRHRDLDTSLGEKMRVDEDPLHAAQRTIAEELALDPAVIPLRFIERRTKGPVPSQSFPGLNTYYVMYHFVTFLPRDWFRPEGYVEVQPDKTNYYVWVPAGRSQQTPE